MLRLNPLQRKLFRGLLSKLLIFPALWYFIWAIYPLATSPYLQTVGFDPLFYLMASLFNWICFVVSLLAAVALEIFIDNPQLRKNLFHLDRGKHKEKSSDGKKKLDLF